MIILILEKDVGKVDGFVNLITEPDYIDNMYHVM